MVATTFLLFGAIPGVTLLVQGVTADAEGLRWRDLRGRRHFAPWSDVTDFYRRPMRAGERGRTFRTEYIIEIADGRYVGFDVLSWTDAARLQERVVSEVGERLDLRRWQTKGVRNRDLPCTFGYAARPQTRARIGLCYCMALPPTVFALFALLIRHDTAHPTSMPEAVFLVATGILAVGFIETMLVMSLLDLNEARRRKNESFTADAEGFTFFDGREKTRVCWAEVIGYRFQDQGLEPNQRGLRLLCSRCTIRSERGGEVSFLTLMDDVGLFQEIVRTHAVNGIEARIDRDRAEALGGIAARWTGGVEGVGERVYHYRTRSNRAMLWFPWLSPVMFALLPVLAHYDLTLGGESPTEFVVLGPLSLVGAVAATMAYYKSCLILGRDGLTKVGITGSRFIRWEDVRDWEVEPSRGFVEAMDGTAIRFAPSSIAHGGELRDRIAEQVRLARQESTR
jgi:hypothetical protein